MSNTETHITLDQLASNNTLKSLWIAVHGQVYDLTTFVSDHPGGVDALESSAGTDGTEVYEYASHSKSNMKRMQKYRIGTILGATGQAKETVQSSISAQPSPKSTPASISPRLVGAALTISATFLAVGLLREKHNIFGSVISRINIPRIQVDILDHNPGFGFWTGIAVASSLGCVGFRYLYKVFLSSLDYENDVFSFPPTIPRKSKR